MPEEQENQQPAGQQPEQPLGDAGKKAIAEERQARKAAEAELVALRKQLETLQGELSTVRTSAEEASVTATRWKVAAAHGIAADDVELFLTASDEETLTKQAQRLSERTQIPDLPPRDPYQGAQANPPALNSDELTEALKSAVGAI